MLYDDPIGNLRISYEKGTLHRAQLPDDPLSLFADWLNAAIEAGILEPNAMTLATADADGAPAARTVLLKGVEADGFRFFTNYESDKGRQLAANPRAALVFYWDTLHRQVRVSGDVRRLSSAESETYFRSRPRDSQIGAWMSPQSRPIAGRAELDRLLTQTARRFDGVDPLPLPPHWGGYRVAPRAVEFWQGRPNRLHDRFRYTLLESGGWRVERLAP